MARVMFQQLHTRFHIHYCSCFHLHRIKIQIGVEITSYQARFNIQGDKKFISTGSLTSLFPIMPFASHMRLFL